MSLLCVCSFTAVNTLLYTTLLITQYGSNVYIGIAMGGPALLPYISVFTFSFNLNLSSNYIRISSWRTCKKVTTCKKMSHEVCNTGK